MLWPALFRFGAVTAMPSGALGPAVVRLWTCYPMRPAAAPPALGIGGGVEGRGEGGGTAGPIPTTHTLGLGPCEGAAAAPFIRQRQLDSQPFGPAKSCEGGTHIEGG